MGCKCPDGLYSSYEKLNYKVIRDGEILSSTTYEGICKILDEQKLKNKIDYVFTFSFSPDISKASFERKLIYISWVWDSPHAVLWSKEARYKSNRIFVFDRSLYYDLMERGLEHVYHLPLAADTTWFDRVISEDAGKSLRIYGADVSFLGNFYNDDKQDLYSQITYLPPYVKGYLDAVITAQREVWGLDILRDGITDYVWDEIKKYVKWELNDRYEVVFKSIIAKKISQLERMKMCGMLNDRYNFALYTDSKTSFDNTIISRGHADYLTQMPLVFRYSKVNIHITLRSIISGIPLRVMDVLACKGFLLTNYQPEICEAFIDGKELVVYSDFDDMYDKIDYYLSHDEERERIAEAGYNKVKDRFLYFHQISELDNKI